MPPISYDEEILLSLDINNLYVKKDYKVSELNISENKEADESFKKLCSIFKNKCMNCYTYCIINANIICHFIKIKKPFRYFYIFISLI